MNIGAIGTLAFGIAKWMGYEKTLYAHPTIYIPVFSLIIVMAVASHFLKIVCFDADKTKNE